jgi:hypothetical protein
MIPRRGIFQRRFMHGFAGPHDLDSKKTQREKISPIPHFPESGSAIRTK